MYKISEGSCNFLTAFERFEYIILPEHAKSGEKINKEHLDNMIKLSYANPKIIKRFVDFRSLSKKDLYKIILLGPDETVKEAISFLDFPKDLEDFAQFLEQGDFGKCWDDKLYYRANELIIKFISSCKDYSLILRMTREFISQCIQN